MLDHTIRQSWVVCLACIGFSSACAERVEPDAGVCPSGPTAPLGGPCATPGLVCAYGDQTPACGGRTVRCSQTTWTEVEHTDPGPDCGARGQDPDDGSRALPLTGLARVAVSRFYCGAVLSSCGGGLGETIDYAVDLAAETLTTTRCTPSDAGPAGRPQTSRALSAEQLTQVQDALADIRIAEADLNMFDGAMQALTLTQADGTTSRYSPAAACGERRYQRVVQGFGALWNLISSFDPNT